mmetsp:Transcript_56778/g.133034  ORF Transcript_56778/g.133034 Transcript_56778/m.133034 type:complete len:201 (+) Transcript_56778:1254-1856(+)
MGSRGRDALSSRNVLPVLPSFTWMHSFLLTTFARCWHLFRHWMSHILRSSAWQSVGPRHRHSFFVAPFGMPGPSRPRFDLISSKAPLNCLSAPLLPHRTSITCAARRRVKLRIQLHGDQHLDFPLEDLSSFFSFPPSYLYRPLRSSRTRPLISLLLSLVPIDLYRLLLLIPPLALSLSTSPLSPSHDPVIDLYTSLRSPQ